MKKYIHCTGIDTTIENKTCLVGKNCSINNALTKSKWKISSNRNDRVVDVAVQFAVSQWTIKLFVRRYRITGSTVDLPRSGISRLTTQSQVNYIRTSHLHFQTATSTNAWTSGRSSNRISVQQTHRVWNMY